MSHRASPATTVPLTVLMTRARKFRLATSSAGSVTTMSEIIAQYGSGMPDGAQAEPAR